MANRIKGITVEIGSDTTRLTKALKNVDSSIKSTQTQLRDRGKLLGSGSEKQSIYISKNQQKHPDYRFGVQGV